MRPVLSGEAETIRYPRRVYNWRSAAPVLQFHRHEAGNRDGEIELPDNRLQIGQTAGEWVEGHHGHLRKPRSLAEPSVQRLTRARASLLIQKTGCRLKGEELDWHCDY